MLIVAFLYYLYYACMMKRTVVVMVVVKVSRIVIMCQTSCQSFGYTCL